MAEVATLSIGVDSSSASRATDDLKKLEAQGKATESAVNDLSAAFKFLAGAMVVREAAEIIKNSVMLAARYETLGATLAVMGNNAGKTSLEMQGFQKELENTGISAIKARGSLQIMAAAQIDVAKAAALGRVAQNAAVLANIDSSTAFQNLVRGIATGESRIIRHMGIMVNFGVAIEQAAKKQGVLASSFSSVERASIRLEAALAEGAKRAGVYEAAMTTAGKQMLSMVRYTENLQVHLGETFNPATNAAVFAMVDALKVAAEATKAWADSGGQAAFAAKLADNIKGGIVWLQALSDSLRQNAGLFVVLGGAMAGMKIASWLAAASQALSVYHGKLLQGQALLINQRMEELALAEAKVVAAQAEQRVIAVEMEGQGTRFKAVALTNAYSAANQKLAAAMLKVTVAQDAVAVSSGLAATEMSAASSIIAGLGGPIGIAIIGLTALAAAWMYFKDKTRESSEDASLSINDAIKKNYEDAARSKEVLKIMMSDQTDKTKKENVAAIEIGQLPQILAARKSIAEWQAQEDRSTQRYAELRKAQRDDQITETMEIVAGARDEAIAERQLKEVEIGRLTDSEVYKRKNLAAQEAYNVAKAKELMAMKDEKPADNKHTSAAYDKEIAKYEEEIALAKARALGTSKEELKILKDKLDFEKELKDIHAKTLGKTPSLTQGEATRLAGVALATRAAKVAADEYAQSQKTEADRIVAAQAPINDLTKYMKELRKETDEFGLSAEDLAKVKLRDLKNNTELATDGFKAMGAELKRLLALRKKQKDDAAEKQGDESYANRLNKSRRDGDTGVQIELLNRAKATGKLIAGVYTKTWIDIMMKGDTATAYIVQSTERLFNSLGTALGNFVTGTKYSFKELMSSLARDLANFYAQKAVMALFRMLFSGVGSSGTSGTGGAYGGFTYTGNGAAAGMFGRAEGGPVTGGAAYIVGEKGPEMFYPGVSGTVVPNDKLGVGGGGAQVSVSIYVDAKNGNTSSKSDDPKAGAELGRTLEAAMNSWAQQEARPGGNLWQLGLRGAYG